MTARPLLRKRYNINIAGSELRRVELLQDFPRPGPGAVAVRGTVERRVSDRQPCAPQVRSVPACVHASRTGLFVFV